MSIAHTECVFVALVIQRAMRLRHSHLWPARFTSFSTLSLKQHHFRKKEKKRY